MKQFLPLVIATAVSLMPLCASGSEQVRPSAEDIATAREQFRLASQLARRGKWDQALDSYERSMALRPSPLTRYSIAIAQQHVGKWIESIENLRIFLLQKSDDTTTAYRNPAKKALKDADGKVARIRIDIPGSPRGVHIQIDNENVSPAIIGIDRLTNPGKHLVVVSVPGQDVFRKTVSLNPGGKARVIARFRNVTSTDSSGAITSRNTSSSGSLRGPLLLATGGVIFAAGATFGVLGYLQGQDAQSTNDEHANKARTFALIGDLSMGAGLAAAGLGTYFLIVDHRSHPSSESASVRLSPWLSPHTGGLDVSGHF